MSHKESMYMPLTTRNLVHVTYSVRALHARLALYLAPNSRSRLQGKRSQEMQAM